MEAGEFRIFTTIVFRLIAPAFVTVLYLLSWAWNNYFLPLLVLSKTNLYPLTVAWLTGADWATQPGQRAVLYILVIMGSVVAILWPLMIVFLFLQRFWQEGEPGQHQGLRRTPVEPLPQQAS